MRKVIASAFLSIDGVMQAPGGCEEDPTGGFKFGGWTFHYWDEAIGQAMGKTFDDPFDPLLGRKTYESFAAHWPFMAVDPVADKFNAVTKYVATPSTQPLAWNNSVALNDVATDLARLEVTLAIGVADDAEAKRVFTALVQGGNVKMPLMKTFWTSSFGMLADKFGVPWMVNVEASKAWAGTAAKSWSGPASRKRPISSVKKIARKGCRDHGYLI